MTSEAHRSDRPPLPRVYRPAQAVTVAALPMPGFFVLTISRDRDLMGPHASRGWEAALALLGYVAVVGIVLSYVRQILID